MTLEKLGACIGADMCIAPDPESYMSQAVGNGQCVSLVKEAAKAPASSEWSEGPKVKGNTKLKSGTAIATFQDGKYWNKTDGSSHAALYMSQDDTGIYVVDQWKGQPTHARRIRFRGGAVAPHNDGDAYSTVLAGEGRDVVGICSAMLGAEVLPSDDGTPPAIVRAKMKKAQHKSPVLAMVAGIGTAVALAGSLIYLAVRR